MRTGTARGLPCRSTSCGRTWSRSTCLSTSRSVPRDRKGPPRMCRVRDALLIVVQVKSMCEGFAQIFVRFSDKSRDTHAQKHTHTYRHTHAQRERQRERERERERLEPGAGVHTNKHSTKVQTGNYHTRTRVHARIHDRKHTYTHALSPRDSPSRQVADDLVTTLRRRRDAADEVRDVKYFFRQYAVEGT